MIRDKSTLDIRILVYAIKSNKKHSKILGIYFKTEEKYAAYYQLHILLKFSSILFRIKQIAAVIT